MGKFGMIVPDLSQLPGASITPGSEASASLDGDNLLRHGVAQKWRSDSRLIPDCALAATGGVFRAVALVGNYTRGSALGRIVSIDGGTTPPVDPPYDEIVANSILATDIAGTNVSYIDNGIATPDVNNIGVFPGDTYLHISFGATPPTDPPIIGPNRQIFAVLCSMNSLGGGRRSITAYLYQDGVNLANLGTKWVTDDTTDDVILYFPWNAIELDAADGSDVEVYFAFEADGGTLLIDEVSWLKEDSDHIQDAGSTTAIDSGWFASPLGPSGYGYPSNPRFVEGGNLFYLFDSIVDTAGFYFYIMDDATPTTDINPLVSLTFESPLQYVEGYSIHYGPWWTPEIEQAHGEYLSYVALDDIVLTDGGGLGGTKRRPLRRLKVSLPFLTIDEMAFLQAMFDQYGTATSFYASLSPSESVDIFAQGLFRFEAAPSFGRKAHGDYQGSAELVLIERR